MSTIWGLGSHAILPNIVNLALGHSILKLILLKFPLGPLFLPDKGTTQ